MKGDLKKAFTSSCISEPLFLIHYNNIKMDEKIEVWDDRLRDPTCNRAVDCGLVISNSIPMQQVEGPSILFWLFLYKQ